MSLAGQGRSLLKDSSNTAPTEIMGEPAMPQEGEGESRVVADPRESLVDDRLGFPDGIGEFASLEIAPDD
jgi:hypothetical protein